MYENIYSGINDALPQVLADVDNYVDTLSPIVEDIKGQQQQKLILDGVQMGLIVVTAPFLHSYLSKLDPMSENPNCKSIPASDACFRSVKQLLPLAKFCGYSLKEKTDQSPRVRDRY